MKMKTIRVPTSLAAAAIPSFLPEQEDDVQLNLMDYLDVYVSVVLSAK